LTIHYTTNMANKLPFFLSLDIQLFITRIMSTISTRKPPAACMTVELTAVSCKMEQFFAIRRKAQIGYRLC